MAINEGMQLLEIEKKAVRLQHKLSDYGSGLLSSFKEEYTGLHLPIGSSTAVNTPGAAKQLEFTLAFSGHPLVDEIPESDIDDTTFDPEPLREAQVLEGLKILDMGCGSEPTFARCARYMGADVYTVDTKTADNLRSNKRYFSDERKNEEEDKHIPLDLNDEGAIDQIIEKTGGEFDIVTCSHLRREEYSPSSSRIEQIAHALLKPRGVYYNATR